MEHTGRMLITILYLVLALITTLLLIRVINIYFIYPVLLNGLLKAPAFSSLFGFLFELTDLGYVSGVAIVIRQLGLQLKSKEQERLLVKEKLETELKFLKNQTNPHFLFNTLNNIYALARKKSEHTAGVVMKLAKILRFMLYESNKKFITIAEEVKLIDDYLDLEKIRYDERLTITFKKDIDNDARQVSPLLLLPFVENAFKHGISESRFSSFINIELGLRNNVLTFSVQNSKENLNPQPGNQSIGLRNVKRQLELMYKEFNLEVSNDEKKYAVQLIIKLNSHAKI